MVAPTALAERLDRPAPRPPRSPSSATTSRSSTWRRATPSSGCCARAAATLIGWKLGVTSRAKQPQVGVDSPIYGFLATDHVLDVGEPLVVSEHISPRCEPEIVFVMGSDLSGAHVTATEVLAATAGVAVGIEVLDSRYTDYRFTMPDVVADNASAGRYVVGTPVPPAGIDLRLVGVVLEHNGDVVATASGAASLGHPAAAVAWLVRSLAAVGEGLRAGDVILSGGLTAAVPVSAGDVVVATSTGSARWSSRAADPRPARPPRRPGALDRRRTRVAPTSSSTSATGSSSLTRSARTSRTPWPRACSATAAWSAPGTGTPSTSRPAPAAPRPRSTSPCTRSWRRTASSTPRSTVEPQLTWSERLRAHAQGAPAD